MSASTPPGLNVMNIIGAEKNRPDLWTGEGTAIQFTEYRDNNEIYLSVMCPDLDVPAMLEWVASFQTKCITEQYIIARQPFMAC